jgi:integrase
MRGSVSKSSGGGWMFIVDYPRGANGRRKQVRRRGFDTRKKAEIALGEMLNRSRSGERVENSKLPFGIFLAEQWLPAMESQLRPTTFDSYARNLRLHIIPQLGHVPLSVLDSSVLNTFYSERSVYGLAPKTIRHLHGVIRQSLSDAVDQGLINRNVAISAKPPRVPRTDMKTWSSYEVRTFLDGVIGEPLGIAFVLAATTGMRRGEVLGLRWSDIDLIQKRLSVSQTLTSVNYELIFGEPKTARGRRMIPLDSRTVELLVAHQSEQNRIRVVLEAPPWPLVVCKPDGSPVHPDTMSDTFDRRVAKLKLPPIRLHDLRHSFATIGLGAGVPVKALSSILGHSSTSFTMDVYAHATPQMLEDLTRTIGASIFD